MKPVQLASILCLATIPLAARALQSSEPVTPVSRASLCITEGSISESKDGALEVDVPKMRAYVNGTSRPEVEVRFTFHGGTGKDVPLGSGEMRRQFGLKLLAADPCNLVYVMWRIEPASKIVVSVKSNPGQHTSAACGNRGYQNLKPRRSGPTPAISARSTHTLRAVVAENNLRVFADGALAWEGPLGETAAHDHGPVGIRSDNAHVMFTLHAALPRDGATNHLPGCRTESGE
jgi:hypothetical protein